MGPASEQRGCIGNDRENLSWSAGDGECFLTTTKTCLSPAEALAANAQTLE
jgi:hypothetical protein